MSSSRKLSRERLSQRNFDRAQVGTRVLGALCTVQTELLRGGHHFENFLGALHEFSRPRCALPHTDTFHPQLVRGFVRPEY